jgi:hypothetical protein
LIITGTEPDSLANLITNLNVAECAAAESAYLQCVNYALTQLNLPNVAMYIDAGALPFTLLPSNIPNNSRLRVNFHSLIDVQDMPDGLAGPLTLAPQLLSLQTYTRTQVLQLLSADWQPMSQITTRGQFVLARLTRQATPTAMSSCTSTLWRHCLQAKGGRLTLLPTPVRLPFFSCAKDYFTVCKCVAILIMMISYRP